ncbi:MAG: hypothetical protein Q9216_003139 [Gyalolechia sp. 2 TL-2023]
MAQGVRYNEFINFLNTSRKNSKKNTPPLPLLFDRVSDGRPITSTSRLLTLPSEIVASILHHLSPASLASLALVNSDCRQLARCHQFTIVRLDYSESAVQFIHQLQAEALERSSSDGSTKTMALGPCVRRLTVATHPTHIYQRHDIDLNDEYQELSDRERHQRHSAAYYFYFDWYLPSIEALLANRAVLPNVQFLDWEDSLALEPAFFDAILKSAIRHLRIEGALAKRFFYYNVSHVQHSAFWPLQSLSLELNTASSNDLSPLYGRLLYGCAPTLESLAWSVPLSCGIQNDCIGPCPPFPSLRHLRVGKMTFVDEPILKELVHDGLMSLEVDTECSPDVLMFFANRGHVPGLKTFVWNSYCVPNSTGQEFLQANSQIQKLKISQPVPAVCLEGRILPLLTSRFCGLTSLSLDWDDKEVSQQSLTFISRLSMLEQLALGGGSRWEWPRKWFVDHVTLRNHLQKLRLLKKLVFSHDKYGKGNPGRGDRYDDVDNWYQIEEEHRQSMVNEAMEYVKVFPHLDWIYLGRFPMAIEFNHEHGKRIARPLTSERWDCSTLINELFGHKGI